MKNKKQFETLGEMQQREFYVALRSFCRYYEFLLLVSSFEDVELHKKYKYATYLMSYLKVRSEGQGFNLDDKIKADGFVQKNLGTKKRIIESKPEVSITANKINLTEDEEKKLSEIIADVNSKVGKNYNKDVAVKSMLQIKDIMMKSDALRASALVNEPNDFEYTYFDNIDDALVEGLSQNQDFFTLLLNNEDIKKEVLGVFANEIYRTFRSTEND